MHQDDQCISMLRQCPSVSSAVRRIAPLAIPPTAVDILLFFTRISQDQNFQTDRIPPLTDITVLLNELWAFWHSMNGVDLRNDESGSVDLLTSATIGSQLGIYDGVPQTTLKAGKLQTVRFPWLTDSEQQCRQLQEIRTCRTSKSRQPFWCNNLYSISFTLTPPTPVSSSSSSPVDRSQPLHR